MIDKVLNFIKDNNMISKGDKVLVALSGGPDSVCLMHILYRLKNELNIDICAAHINHCLRGEDANKDEEYVKELCKRLRVNLYVTRVEVEKYAKEKGLSCEMAGREVRYKFFEEIKTKYNIHKIALAHNANDQAETLIMRIMRGTGLEGLCGIRPVRDNVYIRPILKITRKEIEAYCKEENLKPRIDKTNLEKIYSRNKIRLDLIPYMESHFNDDVISALNRLAYNMQKDNDVIESIIKRYYEKYCYIKENKVIIDKGAFKKEDGVLTRIIRCALANMTGDLNNFEKSHIYNIIDIQKHDTGKMIMLPKDVIAYNNYGDIYLYFNKDKQAENINYNNVSEKVLKLGKQNFISVEKINVSLEIFNMEDANISNNNKYLKYFDYNLIKDDIIFRYKKDGDVFNPLGMNGTKTLKKAFIDMKIPKNIRNQIPLICFGNDIAWIIGYRVSDKYKISNETKKILQIKIERGTK